MNDYVNITTPAGIIAICKNDSFSYDVAKANKYAEQSIIDSDIAPRILNASMILDIGAHVGYHSMAYAKANPNVRILAFEPQNEIFEILKLNINQNGHSDRITPINKCVGNTNSLVSLSNVIDDGPNSHRQVEYGSTNFYNFGGMSIGVNGQPTEMITVDSLQLQQLDYMKIDVEGAEFLVLLGAGETIKKYKPLICFEDLKQLPSDYLMNLGFNNPISSYDVLKSYGYNNFKQLEYQNVLAWIS